MGEESSYPGGQKLSEEGGGGGGWRALRGFDGLNRSSLGTGLGSSNKGKKSMKRYSKGKGRREGWPRWERLAAMEGKKLRCRSHQ